MKKFMVTAAALMLGTSALAWAPAEKAHMQGVQAASEGSASATPLSFSFDKNVMKSESAAIESSSTLAKGDELGMKSLAKWSDATVETASASSQAKAPTDGGMIFAEADIKSKEDVGGIQSASADTSDMSGAKDQTTATGMGGPLDVATGYPPCGPGPGDDRCIQLYEPGVRTALAGWKASDDNVAMGGPFEPAASGAKVQSGGQQGMDHSGAGGHAGHDMSASTGAKPTAGTDSGTDAGAATMKPAATGTTGSAGTTPGAIGGPLEARTGYPPCRPGRGDDRCIQLYERGVTGRNN